MRKLAALVTVFALITNHAWAFDSSHEVVGQVYLSIPFGAVTNQAATPRLGFRVDYRDGPTFADRNAQVPHNLLNWRSNLSGQTTLLLNGVDVGQLSQTLHAAEDEGLTDAEVAGIVLGVVAVGVLVLLVVRANEACDTLNC